MTKRELIEILNQHDFDATVRVWDSDRSEFMEIDEVSWHKELMFVDIEVAEMD